MKLHIYESGKSTAARNMSLDEALLELHAEDKIPPVLRLYGWNPAALTIGYSQDWRVDIDHEARANIGVDAVRRITGGGAVFHDHEITYSIVAPEKLLGENILESFREVSKALVAGLGVLGMKAEFAPLNDIVVNEKKISGNAQVRRRGTILQHGTILLGLNREKMFSMLRVPDEKFQKRNLTKPADRVTSAEEQLNRPISFEEAKAALRSGFESWTDSPLPAFKPTEELIHLAMKINKEKFSNPAWNEKREVRESAEPQKGI